jgi:nucleotide-binding universal stress UspA family protein
MGWSIWLEFAAEADIEVIKKLSKIAKAFKAKIQVVHITTEKEYEVESQMDLFKDKLKKKVDYENIKFKILVSDDVFNTLRMYLEEIEADIVVMLEREKRGLLSKLFHGDLVKKMETYDKLPLLSFN